MEMDFKIQVYVTVKVDQPVYRGQKEVTSEKQLQATAGSLAAQMVEDALHGLKGRRDSDGLVEIKVTHIGVGKP